MFYGISNLISKFHVCPFVCLHRQFVFFVCCFLAHAEIILWSVCPIVHSMVSWHKFIYLVCIQRKKHTKLYGHIFILRVYWFFYRFVVNRWYFSHLNTMHIIQLEIRHMRFGRTLYTPHTATDHIFHSLMCVFVCIYYRLTMYTTHRAHLYRYTQSIRLLIVQSFHWSILMFI